MAATTPDSPPVRAPQAPGAYRVMWMSTIAFTAMFAVWLMFGILGVPIQKELDLTDTQLSWISAVAILNGSLWRLPAGILADRFGGRRVTIVMLLATAVPAYLVSTAHSYGMILLLAFLVGFAATSSPSESRGTRPGSHANGRDSPSASSAAATSAPR